MAATLATAAGERVRIFNQMTETHRIRDLARMAARLTGARVAYLPNPRKEADENELIVKNDQFLSLGLNPITLEDGLLSEVVDNPERKERELAGILDKVQDSSHCEDYWCKVCIFHN